MHRKHELIENPLKCAQNLNLENIDVSLIFNNIFNFEVKKLNFCTCDGGNNIVTYKLVPAPCLRWGH